MLGGISGNWFSGAGATPVPVFTVPVLLVLDNLDGTITATVSNNAGQTSRFLIQEEGDDLVVWPHTKGGNGDIIINGLNIEENYFIVAQPFSTPYIGNMSNIQEITSHSSMIQNRDARNHMSKFIQNLLIHATKFNWYIKRVKAQGIPSSQINVPFIGEPTNVQYNENVHVKDQPIIFQSRGAVPIVIQRTGGYNKADLGFGNARIGDFTAFCSIEHNIEIDDRLIDSVMNIEYRVVHSTPHKDGLYRHLELKWLQ